MPRQSKRRGGALRWNTHRLRINRQSREYASVVPQNLQLGMTKLALSMKTGGTPAPHRYRQSAEREQEWSMMRYAAPQTTNKLPLFAVYPSKHGTAVHPKTHAVLYVQTTRPPHDFPQPARDQYAPQPVDVVQLLPIDSVGHGLSA